jgi:translocation protein SEC63
MHLHAYLAQAIQPGSDELLQLPGIKDDDVATLGGSRDIKNVFKEILNRGDNRADAIKRASLRWGCLEVLDIQFKGNLPQLLLFVSFVSLTNGPFRFEVIGERIITPSAVVQLVFKLRLVSPLESSGSTKSIGPLPGETDVDTAKRTATPESERTQAFLNSKKEAEDLEPVDSGFGFAHAPYWPEVCGYKRSFSHATYNF